MPVVQAVVCLPLGMAVADRLGEGPTWDHRTQRLTWVDILGGSLNVWDWATNGAARFRLRNDLLGFAVPCSDPDVMVCGSQNGVFAFHTPSGRSRALCDPEAPPQPLIPPQRQPEGSGEKKTSAAVRLVRPGRSTRFNDAKVAPCGRLFAGTMDLQETQPKGHLYCIGLPDGQPAQRVPVARAVAAAGPVTISNGLGWSPDGATLYFVDTPTNVLVAFDYSRSDGAVANRRVVFDFASLRPAAEGTNSGAHNSGVGYPDGLCVDSEGCVWVAMIYGGRVLRVDPRTQMVIAEVRVPTPLCTSCCFGGPDLTQLFVTTARGTTPKAAANATDPLAGHLFVATPPGGAKGIPMIPFGALKAKDGWCWSHL